MRKMFNKLKEKAKELFNSFKRFNDDKYGMLIVVSWVVLVVCLIIKLFGGNWFELNVENDKFIAFCNFVDNTMWAKMTLACMIYLFTNYFILCILIDRRKLDKKLILIFFPLMITKSIVNWYFTTIGFILDVIILIVLPIIIGRKWKRVIVGNLLVMAFQLITIGIRNISINFNFNNTFLEQTLIQVDYYIMIILFYLYAFKNKKRKEIE